jgi:hypothetical protein
MARPQLPCADDNPTGRKFMNPLSRYGGVIATSFCADGTSVPFGRSIRK